MEGNSYAGIMWRRHACAYKFRCGILQFLSTASSELHTQNHLAQPNHFPTQNQREDTWYTFSISSHLSPSLVIVVTISARSDVIISQITPLNRFPGVLLAARLKHVHAVVGIWGATHDPLG